MHPKDKQRGDRKGRGLWRGGAPPLEPKRPRPANATVIVNTMMIMMMLMMRRLGRALTTAPSYMTAHDIRFTLSLFLATGRQRSAATGKQVGKHATRRFSGPPTCRVGRPTTRLSKTTPLRPHWPTAAQAVGRRDIAML